MSDHRDTPPPKKREKIPGALPAERHEPQSPEAERQGGLGWFLTKLGQITRRSGHW